MRITWLAISVVTLALGGSGCDGDGEDGAPDAVSDPGSHVPDGAADHGAVDIAGDVDVVEGTEAVATVAPGDDWWLPAGLTPVPNSGFFSEELAPSFDVRTRVVDLTWRQLRPTPGSFDTGATGSAQGMALASWDDQLAGSDPFWMRLWASGVDWAPQWVADECGVGPVGTDYDGQDHLPIWDPCVWGHLEEIYREVFLTRGLREDPRLKLVYVPGAFTWCEFDFDIIEQAVESGLTLAEFDAWFQQAMGDLVTIFDGDDADPGNDYSHKLVFTGEDYPFGPWDEGDDGFALDAVLAGTGIRSGLPEVYDFHLSHVPSYGTTVAQDGHMVTDESWPLLDGERIVATEIECINACGYSADNVAYVVKMANLKALQLRVNWLYVVPEDSYMAEYPDLYAWVRQSLGRTAATSPDAWVALREAEDLYWVDDDSHAWQGKPWVRNFERWLVQRDVAPDGISRRGTESYAGEPDPDNGTAWEGRRTDVANGSDWLYFDVYDGFIHDEAIPVAVKVTFKDAGRGRFWLEYAGVGGVRRTAAVTLGSSGAWQTATWELDDAVFDGALPDGTDLRLGAGGESDVEARFVRVIKR